MAVQNGDTGVGVRVLRSLHDISGLLWPDLS